MAEFITDKQLDDKLTDIIWNAKKELIILSPFIRLDDYCKNVVFKKLKNNPELEIIIVFGKNEGETQRSLTPADLEIFKDNNPLNLIGIKILSMLPMRKQFKNFPIIEIIETSKKNMDIV
jgi:hypothetical protein